MILNYSGGFTVGLISGFVSTLIFTIFFLFYSTELKLGFVDELLAPFKEDSNIGVGIVSFVVAIMGFATTVVLTLTFMQYFKKSWNISQNTA